MGLWGIESMFYHEDESSRRLNKMLGKFCKDDDGHWYFVPQEHINDYENLTRKIEEENSYSDKWYELIDDFCNKFDQFRCEPPQTYLIDMWIDED
jgi:hypothetical protein